jgi:diguanylate cyclase (GGDEF)-like protein
MLEVVMKAWEMPVAINGFSLIILFIFYLDNRSKHHEFKSQKYFFFQHMVIVNIILLVLDGITYIVAGNPDPAARTAHIVVSTVYYSLTPLPSYFFICFADVVLSVPAEKRRRLATFWYSIPIVLNLIVSVVTPFTGWFFRIDETNLYHRGSLLLISFLLSFVLIVIAFVKVLIAYIKAKKENKVFARNIKEYGWMLKFTFIPILGGVMQAFLYNVTYVWNVTVIALLVLYINYQNAEITTDSLTGLNNRRQAYTYFDRFVREKDRLQTNIAVIMMDINNFKSINDRFGHNMGDEAIITVARCLEAEFPWDDFICRFGGDEFIVITKHGTPAHIREVMQRVNDSLTSLNKREYCPFELSLSAGYAIYSKKNHTMDALFKKADAMMFEQKAKLMRRSSDRRKPRSG